MAPEASDPRRWYAHTLKGHGPEHWQDLIVHLREVARLAAGFAAAFGSSEWAHLAGMLHDLGKYAEDFQQKLLDTYRDADLLDASILDAREVGTNRRVDHSSAGAVSLYERLAREERLLDRDTMPREVEALAMVIAGHHAGLPMQRGFRDQRLTNPVKRERLDAAKRWGGSEVRDLLGRSIPDLPAMFRPEQLAGPEHDESEHTLRVEFWTRMLLSTLVDADRLDTERAMNPEAFAAREQARSKADLGTLRDRVMRHLETVASSERRKIDEIPAASSARMRADAVLNLRADVLNQCLMTADGPQGHYSLTVPTGGGKTLASLAFALEHAIARGLRRVIYVIPFTSIIDQTVAVFREAFGEGFAEALIEHHSNLDPEQETYANRAASENWDAPVIVTTSVQFFESLHARRGTAVRKLHNIAKSVVVLDEVQSLPHEFRTPIFDALNRLVDHYGVTTLLCTATQPALELDRSDGVKRLHLKGVREVVADVASAFQAVEARVEADFSRALEPITWEALAAEAGALKQVLVIVHLRKDARDLCRLMPEGTFHLSAFMCAEHRRDVLARIRLALAEGRPCRVVSTTLVEAGVDLDFPVVYRALGGADAMAQAAGRCNRSGRLNDGCGDPIPGRLILFQSPTDPPPGLKFGLETSSILLKLDGSLKLFDPATYKKYFTRFLSKVDPDGHRIMMHRGARNFEAVDEAFRLIDDQGRHPLVVPYGQAADRIAAYRNAFDGDRVLHRRLLRALQPYIVSVSHPDFDNLKEENLTTTIHDQVHWLTPMDPNQYDPVYGLIVDDILPYPPGALVVANDL